MSSNDSTAAFPLPPLFAFSFRALRLGGVEIRISYVVVTLFVVAGVLSLNDNQAPIHESLAPLGLILALFVCMALHEGGHALAAHIRGIRPTCIMLSIVGLTIFDGAHAKAQDEWRIALGGPLVNLMVALALLPFSYTQLEGVIETGTWPALVSADGFLAWICMANIAIALFNLAPLYPLDGSKVVIGLLSTRFDRSPSMRVLWGATIVIGFVGIAFVLYRMSLEELSHLDIAIALVAWLTTSSSMRAWIKLRNSERPGRPPQSPPT